MKKPKVFCQYCGARMEETSHEYIWDKGDEIVEYDCPECFAVLLRSELSDDRWYVMNENMFESVDFGKPAEEWYD